MVNIHFIFAKDFEGLCAAKNKFSITYYAHWSNSIITQNGRAKSAGKKKELGGFHIPLQEIKDRLRDNLSKWKKESRATGSTTETTVADLVRAFIKDGLSGERIKTRGERITYKVKTAAGYKASLTTCILLEGNIRELHTKTYLIRKYVTTISMLQVL